MKKIRTLTGRNLLLAVSLLATLTIQAQNPRVPRTGNASWTANAKTHQPAFVENKGQYLNENPKQSSAVLFGVENNMKAYFTRTGVIYELAKRVPMSREEKEQYEKLIRAAGREENEEAETPKTILHRSYLGMEWEGANPNAQVVPEGKLHEYWNFIDPKDNRHFYSGMAGYQKITYRDLYPGIDVVYTFYPDGGVKYTIYADANADLSVVKMKYTGADKIRIDDEGILHIITENGEITDHAPNTYYASDFTGILSSFELDGKTVSFRFGTYDKNRSIVVDPWTVSSFNPAYCPLEVARDGQDNVWTYGPTTAGQQILEKYNQAGVLQWTVNLTTSTSGFDSYYGDLAVDPSGNSYVSKGLVITPLGTGDAKFDPAGNLVWNNGTSPYMYENWRVTFNCDYTQLLNSGCGPACCNGGRIDLLDPVTGVESNFVAPSSAGDMVCTCFGQNGLLYNVNVNNSIICLDPANSFSLVFDLPNSFGLMDGIQMFGGNGPLGLNGIAAGCNNFYVFLGMTLEKRDLANGNLLNSITVPGGSFMNNMGIAVDKCGNIYVGSSNGVYIYDPALAQIGYFATTFPVNDIVLGANGTFYACGGNLSAGQGFLSQFSSPGTCNSIAVSSTASSCQGADGSATVTPTFCSPPYTYLWSNGDTTATADSLGAGTYTVIVHGAGACNDIDTVSVTISGPISLSLSQTPAGCSNNNGSATATPTGGNGPYTYSWTTSPVQTTQTATNLPAGTYTVTVTDSSGCSATQSIVVQQVGGFQVATSQTPAGCTSNTGTATASPSGGVGPYTYSWTTIPVQTTQTATNLAAGTYTVTVTDSVGCVTTQTIVVQQNGSFQVTTSLNNPTCFGGTNGSATANPSSGTPPYTYSWTTSPAQTTQTATNIGAGTYTVTITDSAGCSNTATVTLTSPTAIGINVSTTGVGCNGGNDGTASASASGGTPGYSYSWNTSPVQTGTIATGLVAGPYVVTATDANGCTATSSVTVVEPPPPPDTLTITGNFCPGDSVATLYAPPGFSGYQWYFDTTAIAGATDVSLDISNTNAAGSYSVTWLLNGCVHHTVITVITPPLNLISPDSVANVFTPNGDGRNDYFYPFADKTTTVQQLIYYAETYELYIYDRWGVEVFYTNDYSYEWDGRYNGNNVPDGVYYWIVTYKARCSTDAQRTEQHGFVHLMR